MGQNQEDDKTAGLFVGYSWGGQQCNKDDADCLAYIHKHSSGLEFYHVKSITSGPERGTLFNPYNSITHRPQHSVGGRDFFEMRPVKKICFDHYIQFLTTKNEGHYRNAERQKDEE